MLKPEEIAKKLGEQVEEFNQTLLLVAEQDMKVEIEIAEIQYMGHVIKRPIITVLNIYQLVSTSEHMGAG